MKSIIVRILSAAAAASVFLGVVYVIMVLTKRSEPAAHTIYGPTARRMWATASAGLALVGLGVGSLAFTRFRRRFATTGWRIGAMAVGP
jgi:hypothetical protein